MILLSLVRTAAGVQADIDARLAAAGLSLAKLAALQALADAREPIALTTLAERLSCVKSNITQLVDRLEAGGLVRRSADANDRRTWLAVLTAAGRKARGEGTRILQRAERDWVRTLSPVERRRLAALLEKVGTPPG